MENYFSRTAGNRFRRWFCGSTSMPTDSSAVTPRMGSIPEFVFLFDGRASLGIESGVIGVDAIDIQSSPAILDGLFQKILDGAAGQDRHFLEEPMRSGSNSNGTGGHRDLLSHRYCTTLCTKM
jgi:hypothetical protein